MSVGVISRYGRFRGTPSPSRRKVPAVAGTVNGGTGLKALRHPRRMPSRNVSPRLCIVLRSDPSTPPAPCIRLVDRGHRRNRVRGRGRGLLARRCRAFPRHPVRRSHAVRRDAAQGAGRLPDRAFVTLLLPRELVARWVGHESGFTGLAVAALFGFILPGGPITIYPVACAFLAMGADAGAVVAFITSWTLIGYTRALVWELPFFDSDFVIWRIVEALPLPILAGLLARIAVRAGLARMGDRA